MTAKKMEESPEFLEIIEATTARMKRRAQRKSISASSFERTIEETKEMFDTNDWSECKARHLVAIYDLMHTKVYGVDAADLNSTARYSYTMMANAFVKREFNGDYIRAVKFLRWAWNREGRWEKWRRENKTGGRRLTIYNLFSGRVLTEYRTDLARRHDHR